MASTSHGTQRTAALRLRSCLSSLSWQRPPSLRSLLGWRFGGDGRCTRIPQSVDAKAEATACASSRSCVKSYPVREEAGILFVWGHAGSPDAAGEWLRLGKRHVRGR